MSCTALSFYNRNTYYVYVTFFSFQKCLYKKNCIILNNFSKSEDIKTRIIPIASIYENSYHYINKSINKIISVINLNNSLVK